MKLYTKFSRFYDRLYSGKNYGMEVEFILEVFKRLFEKKAEKVIDFGCGTGKHVDEFSRRGLEAIGVEKEIEMLRFAEGREGSFVEGDFRELKVEGDADIVVSLFSTIQHIKKEEIEETLRKFCKQLGDEGLCVLDIHNIERRETFVKTLLHEGAKVAKTSTWRLVSPDEIVVETAWLVDDGELDFDVDELRLARVLPGEMEEMAKRAGFREVKKFGGWKGQPITGEGKYIMFLVK